MEEFENKLEKVIFNPEGEDPVEFFVLEQTRIGGYNYILVTDFEEGDGEAWILRDSSADGDAEAVYEFVEDEDELNALSGVFAQMLDGVELS